MARLCKKVSPLKKFREVHHDLLVQAIHFYTIFILKKMVWQEMI